MEKLLELIKQTGTIYFWTFTVFFLIGVIMLGAVALSKMKTGGKMDVKINWDLKTFFTVVFYAISIYISFYW